MSMYDEHVEHFEFGQDFDTDGPRSRADRTNLADLVKVLAPHPGGLRRWSVMRAIRKIRESDSREIPHKFEDEIERTFRRYCADTEHTKTRGESVQRALFYRPKDKAGEVWAIIPGRIRD